MAAIVSSIFSSSRLSAQQLDATATLSCQHKSSGLVLVCGQTVLCDKPDFPVVVFLPPACPVLTLPIWDYVSCPVFNLAYFVVKMRVTALYGSKSGYYNRLLAIRWAEGWWCVEASPTSTAQPDPSVKTNTCQLREVKWVLSGSLACTWGSNLVPLPTTVVVINRRRLETSPRLQIISLWQKGAALSEPLMLSLFASINVSYSHSFMCGWICGWVGGWKIADSRETISPESLK